MIISRYNWTKEKVDEMVDSIKAGDYSTMVGSSITRLYFEKLSFMAIISQVPYPGEGPNVMDGLRHMDLQNATVLGK